MTDDRIEAARRMRAVDGMSKRQIADHFGVSTGTLTKWLSGIEPPAWTKRPNAKDDLRERAREFRLQAHSVPGARDGAREDDGGEPLGRLPAGTRCPARIDHRGRCRLGVIAR